MRAIVKSVSRYWTGDHVRIERIELEMPAPKGERFPRGTVVFERPVDVDDMVAEGQTFDVVVGHCDRFGDLVSFEPVDLPSPSLAPPGTPPLRSSPPIASISGGHVGDGDIARQAFKEPFSPILTDEPHGNRGDPSGTLASPAMRQQLEGILQNGSSSEPWSDEEEDTSPATPDSLRE